MKQQAEQTLAEWLDGFDEKGGRTLAVYETRGQEVLPETVLELAGRFGMDGKIQSEAYLHLLVHGKQVFAVYKHTGAFWYADYAKIREPNYLPTLPNEEDAIQIAEEFLRKNDWLPEHAVVDGAHQALFERVEGKKRAEKTQHPNHICVHFRFSYNRLATYGPGAKIKVHIGVGGEVIGLFHARPEAHVYAEFPSLSKAALGDSLQLKLGVSLNKIKVKNVRLAYHAESCAESRRFIQPVFIFDLISEAKSKRRNKATPVGFEMHPIPATTFAPIVAIKAPSSPIQIKQGERLSLSAEPMGGTPPFKFRWDSNFDGHIGDERELMVNQLSIAHREGCITSHTIKVTVTDQHGMTDSHQTTVKVEPIEINYRKGKQTPRPEDPNDPYVGVEWCNNYDDVPGLANISGTDDSAQGFKNTIRGLPNWSSRFDWGNDAAWEQDFKFSAAPGGGTDSYWADNVHFAFFAGHGSSGVFWFNSSVDDHEMRAQDARLGDGILNWLVLHACQTMRANFEWDVWCDAFQGLHQMFGFHTNTQGSTPPLGSRFAFWLSFRILPWLDAFDMQTAWEIACSECFDASREYAIIYAGQTGTDTHNDHLPGYGHIRFS
jgi:hypothetical protein